MSDLDDLLMCDRQELVMRWRRAFGSTPPKHTSLLFLQKVLAYDQQCRAHGDVPRRIEKRLKAVLHSASSRVCADKDGERPDCDVSLDSETRTPPRMPVPVLLSPGMQLVREWNGRTWQVDVLEDGFACKGKTYRSLSAIARMITGTRWSGPRFFGLNTS